MAERLAQSSAWWWHGVRAWRSGGGRQRRVLARLLVLGVMLLGTAAAWSILEPVRSGLVTTIASDLIAGQATGLAVAADGSVRLTGQLAAAPSEEPFRQVGILIGPLQSLSAPTTGVQAHWQGEAGDGTMVRLEVRGRTGDRYTEWVTIGPGRAAVALAWPATAVQYRLTLLALDGVGSPLVRSVELEPIALPVAAELMASAATATHRVYATRIGLVGHTTANGHIIRPEDRFVALPSYSALAERGGTEYQVRLSYAGRSITVPVWDVGPWNVRDNYWASSIHREMWNDLPPGQPQATAAHRDAYNGGRDGWGRQVRNPAGIDISDGAWAALGMPHADWVTVTFLWTGAGE